MTKQGKTSTRGTYGCRNRLSTEDDLETTMAKLRGQRDAAARWRYGGKVRASNLALGMMEVLRQADAAFRAKHGEPLTEIGTARRAADGDTLEVEKLNGDRIRIRLYGIDAPELEQPFGPPAHEYLAQFEGKLVGWDPVRTDPWGRVIALVFIPGDDDRRAINERMLDAGLAWVDPHHCKRVMCKRWSDIERAARQSRKGLWAQESPEAPWENRGEREDD